MSEVFVKTLDKPKIVYKVGRKIGKKTYTSSSIRNPETMVYYTIDKEIFPRVNLSPLFVFSTLKTAGDFLSGFSDEYIKEFKILECITDKVLAYTPSGKLLTNTANFLMPERLYDFWCIPISRKRFGVDVIYKFIEGTFLVNSLIPLKEVE